MIVVYILQNYTLRLVTIITILYQFIQNLDCIKIEILFTYWAESFGQDVALWLLDGEIAVHYRLMYDVKPWVKGENSLDSYVLFGNSAGCHASERVASHD